MAWVSVWVISQSHVINCDEVCHRSFHTHQWGSVSHRYTNMSCHGAIPLRPVANWYVSFHVSLCHVMSYHSVFTKQDVRQHVWLVGGDPPSLCNGPPIYTLLFYIALVYVCSIILRHVCRKAFTRVRWPFHMCDMTHSCMWHGLSVGRHPFPYGVCVWQSTYV